MGHNVPLAPAGEGLLVRGFVFVSSLLDFYFAYFESLGLPGTATGLLPPENLFNPAIKFIDNFADFGCAFFFILYLIVSFDQIRLVF